MTKYFKDINIDSFSKLSCELQINNELTTIYAKFSGTYRIGSIGNTDGLFVFSKLSSVYFLYDTVVNIVLDLSNLDYTKGNTLLKSLLFFNELGRDEEERNKKVFVIISKENISYVKSLIDNITKKDTIIICDNFEEAIEMTKSDVKAYYG